MLLQLEQDYIKEIELSLEFTLVQFKIHILWKYVEKNK